MPRPKVYDKPRARAVFYCDQELLNKVIAMVKLQKKSLSEYVAELVENDIAFYEMEVARKAIEVYKQGKKKNEGK